MELSILNTSVISVFIGSYTGAFFRYYFIDENMPYDISLYNLFSLSCIAGIMCANLQKIINTLENKKRISI